MTTSDGEDGAHTSTAARGDAALRAALAANRDAAEAWADMPTALQAPWLQWIGSAWRNRERARRAADVANAAATGNLPAKAPRPGSSVGMFLLDLITGS
jgi:hypothetical protein